MSEGDSSPDVVHFYTAMNQEGGDRALQAPARNLEGGREPLFGTDREKLPEGLIALRGPGGFPLLGADAVGNWRRMPTPPSTATESLAIERDDLVTDDLPADQGPLALESSVECTDQAVEAGALPARAARWVWGGFSSGLTVVTLLTLNAVFSNPIAGYDVVPSRLDLDTATSEDPGADGRRRKTKHTYVRPPVRER
jgi:hypothetical protein